MFRIWWERSLSENRKRHGPELELFKAKLFFFYARSNSNEHAACTPRVLPCKGKRRGGCSIVGQTEGTSGAGCTCWRTSHSWKGNGDSGRRRRTRTKLSGGGWNHKVTLMWRDTAGKPVPSAIYWGLHHTFAGSVFVLVSVYFAKIILFTLYQIHDFTSCLLLFNVINTQFYHQFHPQKVAFMCVTH